VPKSRAGSTKAERSIRQTAYLHIQKKIASGDLPAGTPLSEIALSKELGSSRTPIREAIGQLVAEGLLEQSVSGTVSVVKLSRQDIVDLFELREALEIFAAAKAARHRRSSSELDHLQSFIDPMLTLKVEAEQAGQDSLNRDQMNRFMMYDFGFHSYLMRLAANARILKVVNETRLLMRIFSLQRQGHRPDEVEVIYRQHQQIQQAVARGDADEVAKLISHHIQTSCQERLDEFDYWERENSLRHTFPKFFDLNDSLLAK
jgi:DNA-binding GntR family transcriptional regulator